MEVDFRLMRIEDRAEVEEMIIALYAEDPDGEIICKEKIMMTFKHLFKHPEKGKIIVFEEQSKIVGYSVLIFYWSNEYGGDIVHIDELYVKPNWRNQGIATRFIEFISKCFMDRAIALQLEVTPSNKRAFDYYKKIGFMRTKNIHMIKKLRKGELL
ncbi:hypothetical protein TR13x_06765 [Caloranaerobacter sp. TR13]|uniref:GNAT family N-acetyltransferase n=1 Tax=Caloranaerobacter sp. TR13 TaxID=1302151 RepID=UPI0006D47A92|nr:GNAT family N-acetyltransferase [Caloranaerobacter sp. TR13]KPU27091.1 hypothetical protein TR13x_06765 [Caloranaerobacter sp. TR13]